MSNPEISVTNNTIELTVTTDPVNEITVTTNNPQLTLSQLGLQGPAGQIGTTWIGLATGWSTIPTLNTTIADGDVYDYTYAGGTTYYRLIPSGSADDAFYTTFMAGVLSGLVAKKEVSV